MQTPTHNVNICTEEVGDTQAQIGVSKALEFAVLKICHTRMEVLLFRYAAGIDAWK